MPAARCADPADERRGGVEFGGFPLEPPDGEIDVRDGFRIARLGRHPDVQCHDDDPGFREPAVKDLVGQARFCDPPAAMHRYDRREGTAADRPIKPRQQGPGWGVTIGDILDVQVEGCAHWSISIAAVYARAGYFRATLKIAMLQRDIESVCDPSAGDIHVQAHDL